MLRTADDPERDKVQLAQRVHKEKAAAKQADRIHRREINQVSPEFCDCGGKRVEWRDVRWRIQVCTAHDMSSSMVKSVIDAIAARPTSHTHTWAHAL